MPAPSRYGPDRGMVYHQGLPVAVGTITAWDGARLTLRAGPLSFERNSRISVDLLAGEEEPAPEYRIGGVVEEADTETLSIRLDAGSGSSG
ncbi:MAG TPA: hypothetical protein VKA48_06430, partial [Gammaproteobacteria bacterium]|nr:hypothetical protein [Gammaproteobacteria bacterium]